MAFCPTSAIHRSPVSRSNENRHGLRSPLDQISGADAVLADERVVGRDRVGLSARQGRVDAQHLAEQRCHVRGPPLRIAARSAVAHPDVQHPVGPEREVAAVVVGVRLLDLQHDAGLVAVAERAVGVHRVLGDDRPARRVGVVDVRQRPVGVERQPEQAPLAVALGEVGDVEHRRRLAAAEARTIVPSRSTTYSPSSPSRQARSTGSASVPTSLNVTAGSGGGSGRPAPSVARAPGGGGRSGGRGRSRRPRWPPTAPPARSLRCPDVDGQPPCVAAPSSRRRRCRTRRRSRRDRRRPERPRRECGH